MTGAERIAAERKRQVEALGWSAKHDDAHEAGVLAQAAACYAVSAAPHLVPRFAVAWPWGANYDQRPGPTAGDADRVRALEKAGALCAAEIDRILRALPCLDQPTSEKAPREIGADLVRALRALGVTVGSVGGEPCSVWLTDDPSRPESLEALHEFARGVAVEMYS